MTNQRPRPYCDWEHQIPFGFIRILFICYEITRQKPTGKSPFKQEETLSGTRTIWEGGASFFILGFEAGRRADVSRGGGGTVNRHGRSEVHTGRRSCHNQIILQNPLDGSCNQSEADEDLFSFTLQSLKVEHLQHSERRFRRKSDIGAPLRVECCFKWHHGSFQLS